MRTKKIKEIGGEYFHDIYFECPCGKGRIAEEHDEMPGFRESGVYIDCDDCRKRYEVDTSLGIWAWELKERTSE